jgi:hypothetical protein
VDVVRAGVLPTTVTYRLTSRRCQVCGKGNGILLRMQVHKCIMESGMLPDLKVENTLVDMYTNMARWKQLGSSLRACR